jgi:hypothetical protein
VAHHEVTVDLPGGPPDPIGQALYSFSEVTDADACAGEALESE